MCSSRSTGSRSRLQPSCADRPITLPYRALPLAPSGASITPAGGPRDGPSRFRDWPGSPPRRAARRCGATDSEGRPRGVLHSHSRATDRVRSVLNALKQGFRDLGYVEGRNLEARREVLAELAREIVGMQPRVIVTFGTPATDAAKAATSAVPIVFIGV